MSSSAAKKKGPFENLLWLYGIGKLNESLFSLKINVNGSVNGLADFDVYTTDSATISWRHHLFVTGLCGMKATRHWEHRQAMFRPTVFIMIVFSEGAPVYPTSTAPRMALKILTATTVPSLITTVRFQMDAILKEATMAVVTQTVNVGGL